MATITIDVNDLPARFGEMFARARDGDEVIVSHFGQGMAKLVPVEPPPGKRWVIFGLHPGSMVMRADFDDYIDEDAFLRGDI